MSEKSRLEGSSELSAPPSRERKNEKVIYTGAFLDEGARRELLAAFPPIHSRPIAHHMTITFNPSPDEVSETPAGDEVFLTIVGVAEDEKAQAVVVNSPLSTNKISHITISVADGVSPVYSNELLAQGWRKLETPITIRARVGAFMRGKPIFDPTEIFKQEAPKL